ncbi:scavenger receptor cysteine-rich domain superfamily protein-like [Mytilus californianus]|uniref:scavenger receptor cysteine-rich domain superfamily protein-like n=1 Tax=Mytilus californianus TaxID=6549 RepID=UPI0022484AA5|nr:scavenger receptor cysteine-rich domain superfamily protein-like [Mytilus californianus]
MVQNVRLVGGSGPYEGTIELNINGVWGTVCDDDFDINDGNVICRMAGYPSALQVFQQSHFGQGNGSIMLSRLHCTGHEKSVDNCGSEGWYKHNCDHREDAGVACLGNQREGTVQDVRLVGGNGPYEGTIELNINGVWGTVCDDDFDINDGNVICRMAGYPREYSITLYFTGSNRSHIVEGVKFVGGAWPWEGRVELLVNGKWGTICNDNFDVNDAKVICTMAGYSPTGY